MKNKTLKRIIINITVFNTLLVLNGCKKFIDVPAPVTSINSSVVFSDDKTAASVLTGVYSKLAADNGGYGGGNAMDIALFTGLSSDEITLFDANQTLQLYYQNNLNAVNAPPFWTRLYSYIFTANLAIEQLQTSTLLSDDVKTQLLGEAKFVRAFCYINLTTLYGSVPLALTSDYKVNSSLARTETSKVYIQIIQDLLDAKNKLASDYKNADAKTGSADRLRPNKFAASALLARAYLYINDYVNAEKQSADVIDNVNLYFLSSLDGAFLKNSTEAIWQLQPIGNDIDANTGEGKYFILPSNGALVGPNPQNPVYLSNSLINSFEPGDLRKLKWTGNVSVSGNSSPFYYAYKYKIGLGVNTTTQEYIMVLRLSEQYLIRAEARAYQNKLVGIGSASEDINIIRTRAGLSQYSFISRETALDAILKERRVELFTEVGSHRWIDLQRFNKIDSIMDSVALIKGGTWASYKSLFPIPQTELDLSTNKKISQNPGY